MSIKDDMEDVQEAVINQLITENGITNTLADGQVTETKILNGAVTAAKLGSDVALGQVNDGAVTTAKIADDAVTLAKLGSDVNLGQVNTGAVTEHKIANGAVTPAKLSQAYLPLTGGSVTGNVGIGAVAANSRLYVSGPGFAGQLLIAPTPSHYVGIGHGTDAPAIHWQTGDLRIATSTAHDLTGFSEKMRVTNEGNVLVGLSSTEAVGTSVGLQLKGSGVMYAAATSDGSVMSRRSTNGTILQFRKDTTPVGSISVSSSATTYSTSSDYRLKTDAQPMTGATARLKALNPVNFEWISDGTRVDGFLAHEAQAVVPEAVTGTKDALDEEGNPEHQGIDQSKLVPLLTAALQEALTKIEALEVRITNLEA